MTPLGAGAHRTVDSLAALAQTMRTSGKLEEAISMQRRAHALCVEVQGEEDAMSLDAAYTLAQLQLLAGEPDDAERTLERWRRAVVSAGGDAADAAERSAALKASTTAAGAATTSLPDAQGS